MRYLLQWERRGFYSVAIFLVAEQWAGSSHAVSSFNGVFPFQFNVKLLTNDLFHDIFVGNAAFFVKIGKNTSDMPPELCLFVICGKEMLLYWSQRTNLG